jgi:hypothetical protein
MVDSSVCFGEDFSNENNNECKYSTSAWVTSSVYFDRENASRVIIIMMSQHVQASNASVLCAHPGSVHDLSFLPSKDQVR